MDFSNYVRSLEDSRTPRGFVLQISAVSECVTILKWLRHTLENLLANAYDPHRTIDSFMPHLWNKAH